MMRAEVVEAAKVVATATAWKTVDDRKVEVNAAEWDAALLVAREVLRSLGVQIPITSDSGDDGDEDTFVCKWCGGVCKESDQVGEVCATCYASKGLERSRRYKT